MGTPVSDGLLRSVTAVGLRTKILGMVTGVSLFVGVGTILQVRARLSSELRAEMRTYGIALASDLAARSADLILTDHQFGLHELIGDTFENNGDVRYVFVQNANNEVLAHSFARRVPDALLRVNIDRGKKQSQVQTLKTEDGFVTDAAVPIVGGRIGWARIGLSHNRIEEAISQATMALSGVVALALLVSLGLALLWANVLTRPLVELVSVARAVSRGDLTAEVNGYAGDEVGELARAFNKMIRELANSRAELLRRVHGLETLNATGAAVSGKMRLSDLLQAALEKVLEVTNLPAGWISLDDGSGLRLAAQIGLPTGFQIEERLNTGMGCVCEQVLREVRPHVGSDLELLCCCPATLLLTGTGLVCHACVPLVAGRRVVGVVNVASAEARQFEREEINVLDAIGRQVGMAVENARLWEEVKSREVRLGQLLSQAIGAQEAERKRVARELHDEAGQLATTLSLGLRTMEQIQELPETARNSLADLKDLAKRLLDGIRRLAVGLRPDALDQLGLVGAIEGAVREFGKRAGLRTDFEATGLDGVRAPSEVEIAMYRVVQEALANVRKHAGASHVDVLLERRDGAIVAVVEDDGVGFDVAAVRGEGDAGGAHLGLFGMQERATLVNGRLTVESQPGRGTTVFVEIPLGDAQDQSSLS